MKSPTKDIRGKTSTTIYLFFSMVYLLQSTVGFSMPRSCTATSSSRTWRLHNTSPTNKSTSNGESIHNENNTSACPFSMTFPRYRIPISGGKDVPNSNRNNILSRLFSGIVISSQKSEFERKYSSTSSTKKVIWYDPRSKLSSSDNSGSSNDKKATNDEKERIERGQIGVHVSAFVWRALANLLHESIEGAACIDTSNSVVIGLPHTSLVGLKQLADIINWMEEKYYMPPTGTLGSKINLGAIVDEDSPVPTIILTTRMTKVDNAERTNSNSSIPITQSSSDSNTKYQPLNEDIVRERTKAWVDRVLVKMSICPFTKSTTKSGQGLRDVGVPVGDIAYHYSSALQWQFALLMADTWEAISDMVKAGPNGISSILLAAPEFDSDFSLWAGPLFAMLEANCCAARAEPIIGIVCFHPGYKTPDGKSWPGFGHMHSLPRLGKWLQQNDEELFNEIEESDISAGGAFQRRTPHATINVLRAEQLEAAEGRRSTGSLYSVNIRRLYEEGFGKLGDDLTKEQNLLKF